MRYTPLEEKIVNIVKPVIEDLGFALHRIKISSESSASIVQIMAEDTKARNLMVDDAAKISRAISAIMDVEDPINGEYRLEVSSPGIDRMLITQEDFENYKGHEAKLELLTPDESGQKRFRGIVNGIKDNNILVTTDTGEVELPYASLSQAKLILTDELIKATANF